MRRREETAARGARSADGRKQPSASAAPTGRRVLLADDSDVNRAVAGRLLSELGHVVTEASGGGDAVARFAAGHFDVVLMDVQMPGMDGLEATAAIRRLEKPGVRTRVVALTASAREADEKRCLAAGMDAVLPKPLRKKWLEATLASLFESSYGGDTGFDDEGSHAGRILDRDSALAQADGDLALFTDLVRMLEREVAQAVSRMKSHLAMGRLDAVERAAHKLKGSLAMLHASPASSAASVLERASRSGSADRASRALSQLEIELARLEPELRSALA